MLDFFFKRPLYWSSLAMMLGGIGVIIAAILFEHVGGYKPCELCLLERKPWYFAAPAGLMALIGLRGGLPFFTRMLLAVLALLFAMNAGLALYHAGIEWKWWLGPASCTGGGLSPLGGSAGDLLDSLNKVQIVRCDEAQFRIFGLSFAGYNFFMSAGMAIIALAGLLKGRRNAQ